MSILRNLPDDSALTRYRSGWPTATHLAARTLEELGALTRITLLANGVKKSKLPAPIIIDRPTPQASRDIKATRAALAPEMPQDAPPARGWLADLVGAEGIVVEAVG